MVLYKETETSVSRPVLSVRIQTPSTPEDCDSNMKVKNNDFADSMFHKKIKGSSFKVAEP